MSIPLEIRRIIWSHVFGLELKLFDVGTESEPQIQPFPHADFDVLSPRKTLEILGQLHQDTLALKLCHFRDKDARRVLKRRRPNAKIGGQALAQMIFKYQFVTPISIPKAALAFTTDVHVIACFGEFELQSVSLALQNGRKARFLAVFSNATRISDKSGVALFRLCQRLYYETRNEFLRRSLVAPGTRDLEVACQSIEKCGFLSQLQDVHIRCAIRFVAIYNIHQDDWRVFSILNEREVFHLSTVLAKIPKLKNLTLGAERFVRDLLPDDIVDGGDQTETTDALSGETSADIEGGRGYSGAKDDDDGRDEKCPSYDVETGVTSAVQSSGDVYEDAIVRLLSPYRGMKPVGRWVVRLPEHVGVVQEALTRNDIPFRVELDVTLKA